MDVVYVLGTGSSWNNNELRFSLRALKMNCPDVEKIFIVGEFPSWANDRLIHIPAKDFHPHGINADGNIIRKVREACNDPRVSENFLFINDDHTIIRPTRAADVPFFHKGDMTKYSDGYWNHNYWRGRLKATMEELVYRGETAYHYDCHTPIVFNKAHFIDIMDRYDTDTGIGLCMKSLYANTLKVKGKKLKWEKRTAFWPMTGPELVHRFSECGYMTYNDRGLTPELKLWLQLFFPDQSKYERTPYIDRPKKTNSETKTFPFQMNII